MLDLVKSNSEGRRAIQQGGVKMDGEKISDENLEIDCSGEYHCPGRKAAFCPGKFCEVKLIIIPLTRR